MKTFDEQTGQAVADYIGGEMNSETEQLFEARLQTDADLHHEVNAARATLAALKAVPEETVSRDLAPAILAKAKQRSGGTILPLPANRFRVSTLLHLAAAAAAVLVVGTILFQKQFQGQQPGKPSTSAPGGQPVSDTVIAAETATPRARACTWLANAQHEDGSMAVADHGGKEQTGIGVTGLALMAFCDEGDAFKGEASRAAAYLASQQDESGRFGAKSPMAMYNHGIATVALLAARERFGLRDHDTTIEKAVAFLKQSQTDDGGWGYAGVADEKDNTSVSAWQVLALHEAAKQKFDTAKPALTKALAYLGQSVDESGAVRYSGDTARPTHRALTAVGAACLLLDPQTKELGDKALRAALKAPATSPEALQRTDPYLTYFLLRAIRTSEAHKAGQDLMVPVRSLIARQVATGPETGSLPAETTAWGAVGGRVYTTAMLAVSLPEKL